MLHNIRQHIQDTLRLPQIKGEYCVHAKIEQASCRACVDVCPQQAWHLDEDSLGMDTAICDGCGLCVPVCPENAILHDHDILLKQLNQHTISLIACEKANLPQTTGIIPCLHSLGLTDLLKLYQQGVRGILMTQGDCDDCPRQPDVTLTMLLENLNQALKQRGVQTLLVRKISSEKWLQQQNLPPPKGKNTHRRDFLQRSLQHVAKESLQAQGLIEEEETFLPPAQLLPQTGKVSILPHVPEIDATKCDGCGACMQLCPHDALKIDEEKQQFVLDAINCTGCHLCVDVCVPKAITVKQWILPDNTVIPLHHGQCQRCGAPFQRPVAFETEKNLCHICRQVNHHKLLYQVLD